MIKKLRHIIIGWAKFLGLVKTSITDAELSAKRLSICKGCPNRVKGSYMLLVGGSVVEGIEYKCKLCGCPLEPKSLVKDEKCDDGKW